MSKYINTIARCRPKQQLLIVHSCTVLYNLKMKLYRDIVKHSGNKAIVDIRLRPRCAIPTPSAADNRLVQRLQSSVCPYRVHAASWTSLIRNS